MWILTACRLHVVSRYAVNFLDSFILGIEALDDSPESAGGLGLQQPMANMSLHSPAQRNPLYSPGVWTVAPGF